MGVAFGGVMNIPGKVPHPLELGAQQGWEWGQEPSRPRPGLLVSHLRPGQGLSFPGAYSTCPPGHFPLIRSVDTRACCSQTLGIQGCDTPALVPS